MEIYLSFLKEEIKDTNTHLKEKSGIIIKIKRMDKFAQDYEQQENRQTKDRMCNTGKQKQLT